MLYYYDDKRGKMLDKITIRLNPNQRLVLDELKQKFGCNYSLLIRTIISDFLTRNEEYLDRMISGVEDDEEVVEEDYDELNV